MSQLRMRAIRGNLVAEKSIKAVMGVYILLVLATVHNVSLLNGFHLSVLWTDIS